MKRLDSQEEKILRCTIVFQNMITQRNTDLQYLRFGGLVLVGLFAVLFWLSTPNTNWLLQKKLGEVSEDIENLKTEKANNTDLKNLNSTLYDHRKDLENLNNTLYDHRKDLKNLNSTLDDHRKDLDIRINTLLQYFNQTYEEINEYIKQESIGPLSDLQNGLERVKEGLHSLLNATKSDIRSIQKQLKRIKNNTDATD